MPKKWKKGGTLWEFSTCKIPKKLKGGPFGEKRILGKKVSQCRKTERGDPLVYFNIHSVAKHQKIKGGKNFIPGKKSHSAEAKLKRGALWDFPKSILSQNSKNLKGDPLEKNFFRKKVSQCRKKRKGDPLVSPSMACYAGKQEKPFWFSSLDRIVQFGAIIFCRTFKNYFGQFAWIEKKATIIVAFHFMKRRLQFGSTVFDISLWCEM